MSNFPIYGLNYKVSKRKRLKFVYFGFKHTPFYIVFNLRTENRVNVCSRIILLSKIRSSQITFVIFLLSSFILYHLYHTKIAYKSNYFNYVQLFKPDSIIYLWKTFKKNLFLKKIYTKFIFNKKCIEFYEMAMNWNRYWLHCLL